MEGFQQSREQNVEESPIHTILKNNSELAKIYNTRLKSEINVNENGEIVTEQETYSNTPRMQAFVELANAIQESLPKIPEGYVRLWRGNRPNEVGNNPSYTNSLAGIALPFLAGYNGVLSYIDVPQGEASSYIVSGAKDAEFILPSDLVSGAHIVGFTQGEAEEIKKNSSPLTKTQDPINGWDIQV